MVEIYSKTTELVRSLCQGHGSFRITANNQRVIYVDPFAGDTSETEYMKTELTKESLDYALLPTDGFYNMDVKEAQKCAEIIGAKHAIPIHMKPGELFDMQKAEQFVPSNRMIIKAGEEIELE